jgi:hypothetical protein
MTTPAGNRAIPISACRALLTAVVCAEVAVDRRRARRRCRSSDDCARHVGRGRAWDTGVRRRRGPCPRTPGDGRRICGNCETTPSTVAGALSSENTMKRTVGLLILATMLHLVLVGTDLACASHGVASVAGKMAGMPDHHAPVHPTGSHSEGRGDCHTPAVPDCCNAVSSWAPSNAPATVVATGVEPQAREALTPGPRDAWVSRVTAPETPPPRA